MIRIEVCPAIRSSGGYYQAVGHAENRKVCTAVTAIEECLAANLDASWNVRLRRNADKGNYTLLWNKSDRAGKGLRRANDAAGFAYNGLRALAERYPDDVKVEWKKPEEI